MNDIQRNYLIGLVFRKIKSFDLDAIKEVNVNNDAYINNIEIFVNEYAKNSEVIAKILAFVTSEDAYFKTDTLDIGKVGSYLTIKFADKYFTIGGNDFTNLLMTIECYMKDYLPLGSVVRLNKEKLKINDSKDLVVVIEQRMIHPKGKKYYIDYRAIPYPMGVFNEQMYVYFATDDIEAVIYNGYSDPENEGYELALKESLIDNNVFSNRYQKSLSAEEEAITNE